MPEVETMRVETMKEEEVEISGMKQMCSDLFREWLVDLNLEEKKIWLWNALVGMQKIKQRRS
jgi:hypothetical protein